MASGSLLNERPPLGLLITQAVGITTSAFLTGQIATLTFSAVPAILKAPAPLAARQWQSVYDIGAKVGPALGLVGLTSLGYVAYREDPSSLAFKLNVGAALLLPAIIPYTRLFMLPTNNKLSEKAQSLASTELTDKAAEAGVAQEETVHALIDRWATLNLGRAVITGIGAILATWAALDKLEAVGFKDAFLSTGANRMG